MTYLESLFLPIFAGLQAQGVSFDVLQFRWGDKTGEDQIRQACDAVGIGYRAAPVWRWGGAAGPFLSAMWGGRHVRSAVRHFKSDIVMPRGMMPSISALAGGIHKTKPLLFDADGLPTDERVDVSGLSPTGATYRILRDVEAQTVRFSKSVLVRTQPTAEILYHRAGPPVTMDRFHVVANGRDGNIFQPFDPERRAEVRRRLQIEDTSPLLIYAGSMGPQYRLDAMASLHSEVRKLRPDAHFLVLTGSPELVSEALGDRAAGSIVMRVSPGDVPLYLAAADVGLAYRSTSFSMQGVAPVKLSEYLLCGLPVIGTGAVGDTQSVIGEGVFFNDDEGSPAAAQWLVGEVLPRRDFYRAKARSAGESQFSLERSLADYARALEPFRHLHPRG